MLSETFQIIKSIIIGSDNGACGLFSAKPLLDAMLTYFY